MAETQKTTFKNQYKYYLTKKLKFNLITRFSNLFKSLPRTAYILGPDGPEIEPK